MRTRKGFAFVLALIMILTLVPASAFAATDNSVAKVPAVAEDANMPWVNLTTVIDDAAGLPVGSQVVKFTVENGEWARTASDLTTTPLDIAGPVVGTAPTGVNTEPVIYAIPAGAGAGTLGAVGATATNSKVIAIGDNWIEVELYVATAFAKGSYISFNLGIKSGSDAGDVKVKVESIDSQFTSGTYTVGVVAGGKTVATVQDKVVKTSRAAAVATANIEIRETAVNTVDGTPATSDIKLTLPKGVTWGTMTATEFSGNLGAVSAISAAGSRDLTFTLTPAANSNLRQVLIVKPIIDIGKDARLGEISVQIRADGDIENASGLVIAEYVEEGVTVTTVKEKDIPTIYAGYEQDGSKDYEVKVIVEETTDGSLIAGKFIDFEFPEWVQLTDVNTTPGSVDVKINSAPAAPTGIVGYKGDDTSSFEWAVTGLNVGTKDKFEFIIPVTVEAGHSGDLEVKVTGAKAGLDDTTLVVAKVVNPVTAEAKLTDLKTGVQKQAGGEIVIKETEAGAIRDEASKNIISVSIEDLGLNFSTMGFKDAKAKVTAGDLEIKKVDVTNAGIINITVDKSSIKTAAEITISDIEITLDRTLPEGKYAVRVGGTALVDNNGTVPSGTKPSAAANGYNNGDFTAHSVKADYITIVTAADQAVNAKFVIGSKDYVVNSVTKTMDAEAYIDTAGRTMVPIRFVADALGINESQIIWNQASATATIVGKQVVSITVGDAKIIAGGTAIAMDTVAVNLNGRIYVPARYVSTALGANVDWDAATKTVSIYTVK
ncbi:MAG: copper amine oxidase N-terminal domain-containing protein [Eubacteriales bacterium]|nr:copper amine oxidase N-terminal domain-containing protein [Eubacteriales bacterium]